MSVSYAIKGAAFTIPNGAANSNILNANEHYGDAAAIGILSPSALDAITYTFQGSVDGVTFVTLQIGTTLADITVPAASKAATYLSELLTWPFLRIHGTGNAAADRIFNTAKHYTTGSF